MRSDDGELDFDLREARDAEPEESLIVDTGGFEGPLHVLLELARKQKVDLRQVSILELSEQYLGFITEARKMRIELAADYLVMAAWLAWLKSRLLLPQLDNEAEEEGDPEELAKTLAFRLQRLEAMRNAAESLFRGDQLGQDVFPRGKPEGLRRRTAPLWEADLYDLLKAYGERRSIVAKSTVRFEPPKILPLDEARTRLNSRLGEAVDWRRLSELLPPRASLGATPPPQKSVNASGFAASLELVKEGRAELRQAESFAPLWLRRLEHSAKEQSA